MFFKLMDAVSRVEVYVRWLGIDIAGELRSIYAKLNEWSKRR